MKDEILSAIDRIEKEKSVKILWAIESGSRAWGFESEDSDYDVRCMHIGTKNDYLGLFQPPLQINLSEGLLDVESWDIKKFSELTLKSNPQIAEWLRSTIIYRDSEVREKFRMLFDAGCSLEYLREHYLRMAKGNYHKYLGIGKEFSCKKYLYVLRALACSEYIDRERNLPPLPYKEVIHYLPKEAKDFFEKCVLKKNKTEDATIPPNEVVSNYVESHIGQTIPKKDFEFSKTQELNDYLIRVIDSYS